MKHIIPRITSLLKPILYKTVGVNGYKRLQAAAMKRNIRIKGTEEPEMVLLPDFISPTDQVIDVGANFIYYTERLSRLVPDGQVFSFEPIPFTYDVGKIIIRDLKLKNVTLFNKGVGQRTEILRFAAPHIGGGVISGGLAHIKGRDNSLIKKGEVVKTDISISNNKEFDCEVVDLDSFLLPHLKKVTFIKIDIEGAEYFALQGMEKISLTFRPVILIEVIPTFLLGYGVKMGTYESYIRNTLQYAIYRYDVSQKKLVSIEKMPSDKSSNYILIPEERGVSGLVN